MKIAILLFCFGHEGILPLLSVKIRTLSDIDCPTNEDLGVPGSNAWCGRLSISTETNTPKWNDAILRIQHICFNYSITTAHLFRFAKIPNECHSAAQILPDFFLIEFDFDFDPLVKNQAGAFRSQADENHARNTEMPFSIVQGGENLATAGEWWLILAAAPTPGSAWTQ